MSFFSVIIPVYNASEWIEECLNSVSNQSFKDFNIVLVDDGSTDDSLEKVTSFKENHENLELNIIPQSNLGLGAARNTAVKTSVCEWLVFLDADDSWSTNKLQTVYNAINENESLWYYHGVFEKYSNGLLKERSVWQIESLHHFLAFGNPITPSATVMKKSLFLKYNGFDEERDRVEDLGLWLKILIDDELPHYLSENMTVYRMGTGLTNDLDDHLNKVYKSIEPFVERKVISEELFEQFKNRKGYELARQKHKSGLFKDAVLSYKMYPSLKVKALSFFARIGFKI